MSGPFFQAKVERRLPHLRGRASCPVPAGTGGRRTRSAASLSRSGCGSSPPRVGAGTGSRRPRPRGEGAGWRGPDRAPAVRASPELAATLGILPPTPSRPASSRPPLEPMVVMAGAGSGKSETMAGRVVWLVANGLVRPEQVLGLTFTARPPPSWPSGSASGSTALRPRRAWSAAPSCWTASRPISTYHAYAGPAGHRPRPARGAGADHAPGHRRPSPGSSPPGWWRRTTGRWTQIELGPATVTGRCWSSPGSWPSTCAPRRTCGESATGSPSGTRRCPAARSQRPAQAAGRSSAAREQLLPLVEGVRAAQARPGGRRLRRPDGAGRPDRRPATPRSARSSAAASPWCCSTSTRTPATPSSCCCARCSAAATRSPRWATPASPSTAGAAPRRATSPLPQRLQDRRRRARPRSAAVASASATASRVLDVAARCSAAADGGPRGAGARPRRQPGRARAGWCCAFHETAEDEAEWIADGIAGMLGDEVAPDGLPWGEEARRPSRRVRRCVSRRRGDPGRKRSQFPALRRALEERDIPVEVVGLGGLLAVPEVTDIVATLRVLVRPDRGRRPGPAARRAALADRPRRPARSWASGPAS